LKKLHVAARVRPPVVENRVNQRHGIIPWRDRRSSKRRPNRAIVSRDYAPLG
jgi:hypothetical protein